MQRKPFIRTLLAVLPLAALLVAVSPVFGQQTYVTRYDAYVGYSFLNSPAISLFEPGVAAQFGFRPKTWYSMGVDYTYGSGDLKLTSDLLTSDLQKRLGGQLAQLVAAKIIPASYQLVVPAHSKTHTIAVGPQLAYRHFPRLTLFLRPLFLGAIHETAIPKPGDAIATAIVKQLAPSGQKVNTVLFLGFGGGFDIILSNHFSIRAQADLVYDHLFDDLLRNGRYTTRFSIGPAFNFGKNIAKK
jgi:hypothetical protein